MSGYEREPADMEFGVKDSQTGFIYPHAFRWPRYAIEFIRRMRAKYGYPYLYVFPTSSMTDHEFEREYHVKR